MSDRNLTALSALFVILLSGIVSVVAADTVYTAAGCVV